MLGACSRVIRRLRATYHPDRHAHLRGLQHLFDEVLASSTCYPLEDKTQGIWAYLQLYKLHVCSSQVSRYINTKTDVMLEEDRAAMY